MSLASGTNVRLTYQAEVTRGTAPVSPDMKILRATGRAINRQVGSLRSNEVRSDRQTATLRHGFNQVVGTPGYELSLKSYDDFIEACLSGTWGDVKTADNTQNITVAMTGGKPYATFTRVAGSFVTDGFDVGMVVTPQGFTNTENNAKGVVVNITTNGTVMWLHPLGSAYVSEAGTGNEGIAADGKVCKIGSTLRTFTVERGFTDVGKYQLFHGCAINQMSVDLRPEQIVNGTFNILGMSADAMSDSSFDSTPTVAATNDPFNAFNGELFEGIPGTDTVPGGLNQRTVVTGATFTINNNRSLQAVVGSKFSPDVFEGVAAITGELGAFFEDESLFNRFANESIAAMSIKLDDLNGTDFMILGFPAIKYTAGDIDPPQNGPINIRMPFECQVSAMSGNSFYIQRSNTT